jgi:YVTN family beta-propeller protein
MSERSVTKVQIPRSRRKRWVVGVAGLSVLLGPVPILAAPTAAATKPVAVAIPVGTSPLSVAADSLTDMVYAANSGSFVTSAGTVTVIDGHQTFGGRASLGQVVATIDVGRYPVSVAVDPVTDIVYVANGGSDSISVIDGTTNKVTATIALSTEPEGIGVVPSTDMIYVALPDGQSAGTVAVINGHTNAVVGSIPVGEGPWGVGVNTASGTVYVSNQGGDGASTNYDGTVSVIHGTSVVATVTVGNTPFGIGVDPLTGMAYVATMDEAGGSEPSEVVVIDGQNSIVTKIQVANAIGVAVDSPSNTVFVGLKYSGYADGPIGSLAIISGRTNSVTAIYGLGGNPWGAAVDPTTGRVYLASDTKPGLVYMVGFAGRAAPTLEVTVAPAADKVVIGSEKAFTVIVDAVNGDVSSISLGAGLTSSSDAATVSAAPANASDMNDFDLEAGESRSFDFMVKGVDPALVTLTAHASGTAQGQTVTASGQADLTVTCPTGTSPPAPSSGDANLAHSDDASADDACPDAINWDMGDRVKEGEDVLDNGLPKFSYLYPDTWKVKLSLTTGSQPAPCPSGYVWKWDVKAVATSFPAPALIVQPDDGCQTSFTTTQLGTYKVVAQRYQQTDTGLKITTVKVTNDKVVINDLLIVGLGDSNGSGEGDPGFYDEQCHRGTASYQFQAAEDLEAQFGGHTSITFVNDSCSGASIQNLDDVSYAGVDPSRGTPLDPQIRALKTLIDDSGGLPPRKVDAAFVSVGINNIGFGALLEYCIKQTIAAVATDEGLPCEDQAVAPTYGSDGTVVGFTRSYNDQRALTLRQWVAKLTSDLPGLYGTIKTPLAGLVDPDRTFLTQYPTFTYKTAQGEVCDGGIFEASTWQWLAGGGAALNAQVAAAAGSDGWHGVGVNPKYFLGHGYCSSDSYFVPVVKALVNNRNGAFHANEAGAAVTARLVAYDSCSVVASPKDCDGIQLPPLG